MIGFLLFTPSYLRSHRWISNMLWGVEESFWLSSGEKWQLYLSLPPADPVSMPRRGTWSWTVENRISLLPSSASPRRPPTRPMRVSRRRLPLYPASCVTPGPPPTPMKLLKSPPYNVWPSLWLLPLPPPPHPHLLWTSQPLKLFDPEPRALELRFWGQGRLRRILEYCWFLSPPLTILWISGLKQKENKMAELTRNTERCENEYKAKNLRKTRDLLKTFPRLKYPVSCILDHNMNLLSCTVLTL